MTTILLILVCLLIAVVVIGGLALQRAIHKQTVALGRAYGNVNDTREEILQTVSDLHGNVIQRLDLADNDLSITKAEINANLLEMTTAITNAFMVETIEIKQGVEAIVDVLSSAASDPTTAGPASSGPCAVKGCTSPATVTTSWKMDILTPAEDVNVCEPHAEMMAKQAFQAPKKAAAPKRVAGQRAPDDKCEHGIDMGPDYVWGQIHAHIDDSGKVVEPKVPDRETFAKEHEIGEGAPDESILTPEPLDPITAAIEASFRAGKSS